MSALVRDIFACMCMCIYTHAYTHAHILQGYASMEYSLIEYRQNDLVKLDVAVNGDNVSHTLTSVDVMCV